ncbi:MAG: ZIP family metal transporter [bacterium]|nr:ZIP family metal transporter [bacterium]
MTTIFIYTLVSVLIVSIVSLIGVITLSANTDRLRSILLYLVSFSAGALLGDVFIHLLPEYIEEHAFGISAGIAVLSGIVAFFILEQIIHWHHHHSVDCGEEAACPPRVHAFAVTNLVGDAFHNFLDGIVIAAAYLLSIPVGISTTIAVILHEIPQEIGDFGVLVHGGFSRTKAILFNLLTALTAVLGALLALYIGTRIEGISLFLAPFAAGSFIYIAGADLIPEVHRDKKNTAQTILKLLSFLAGIAVMLLLLLVEFEAGY